jgi:histidine triad (HIT) family protein
LSEAASGSYVSGCLFCRIVSGEVPGEVLMRTEEVVAFRDINPQAPLHALVVPVRHIPDAASVAPGDADVLAGMLIAARQVAEDSGLASGGYRLVMNIGQDAGNTVDHLHLHVLAGRRLAWPPG